MWDHEQIKELRRRREETQQQFAAHFRLGVDTVRGWEYGKFQPSGAATVILDWLDEEAAPAEIKELEKTVSSPNEPKQVQSQTEPVESPKEELSSDESDLLRKWWQAYCFFLQGCGGSNEMNRITDEAKARGVIQHGQAIPRYGAFDLARQADAIRGTRRHVLINDPFARCAANG